MGGEQNGQEKLKRTQMVRSGLVQNSDKLGATYDHYDSKSAAKAKEKHSLMICGTYGSSPTTAAYTKDGIETHLLGREDTAQLTLCSPCALHSTHITTAHTVWGTLITRCLPRGPAGQSTH